MWGGIEWGGDKIVQLVDSKDGAPFGRPSWGAKVKQLGGVGSSEGQESPPDRRYNPNPAGRSSASFSPDRTNISSYDGPADSRRTVHQAHHVQKRLFGDYSPANRETPFPTGPSATEATPSVWQNPPPPKLERQKPISLFKKPEFELRCNEVKQFPVVVGT